MPELSAEDLEGLATAAFGNGWKQALAEELGVSARTVERWAEGGVSKPETAGYLRCYLAERERILFEAPPDDLHRDQVAYDLVKPRVDALLAAAAAAGWHPAVVGVAVTRAGADGLKLWAGSAQVIETLKAIIASVKARRDT